MKNYYNLISRLWDDSRKRTDGWTLAPSDEREMTERRAREEQSLYSACSAVDVPMTSYGASDEHPMSTRSASDGTRWNSRGWKYAACILMLLVLSIGQMWGTEYTFINQSNGKYTGDFYTGRAESNVSSSSMTIHGLSCSYRVKLNSTGAPGVPNTDRYIKYDVKTTATQIIVYFYNNNSSSDRSINLGEIKEGEGSFETTRSKSITKQTADTLIYNASNTTNSTIYITVPSSAGDVYFYQVRAIETGTALKKAGEGGYELDFNKGRVACKSGETTKIDGITIIGPSGDYTAASGTVLKFAKDVVATKHITFTTPASPCKLKLTWSGGQMAYNTSASSSGATNITSGSEYTLSASTTYYLVNTGNAESSLSKLEFKTLVIKDHTVTAATSTGDNSRGTVAARDETLNATETTTITATPAAGYQVSNWAVSGTGASISPSGASNATSTTLTMGSENATVTATFEPVYASGTYTFTGNQTCGESPNSKEISSSAYTDYDAFRVDEIFFSATKMRYETGGEAQYDGWKIQYSGATIKFLVENDCNVKITLGANAGMNITYTRQNSTETTTALEANKTNSYDVEGGTLVTLTTTSSSTITLKEIQVGSSCTAPTSVTVSSPVGTTGWAYIAGETIQLHANVSGGSGTPHYTWQKKIDSEFEDIDGAPDDDDYEIANCTASNSGTYRCIVSTGAGCSTTSAGFDVKVYRVYVKLGEVYTYYDFTSIDRTEGYVQVDIPLQESSAYAFKIMEGHVGLGNNDGTGLTSSNSNNWGMYSDNANFVGLATNFTDNYRFTWKFAASSNNNTVSVTYPEHNQASGKTIYFDNSTTNWSNIYYRIGHLSNNQNSSEGGKNPVTKVAGTANFYSLTTWEYGGFYAWHFADNVAWSGGNTIYNLRHSESTDIDNCTDFQKYVVTENITLTPTTTSGSNPTYYAVTKTSGMKTYTVTSSATNCSITLEKCTNYGSGTYTALSSGGTVMPTQYVKVTVTPSTGYEWNSFSVSGTEGTDYDVVTAAAAGTPGVYIIMGDVTFTASCSISTYDINYHDGKDMSFSGSHADGHPTTHTYGTATDLKTATKSGYVFGGWYDNNSFTGDPVTSLGATTYTADIDLYAKWEKDVYLNLNGKWSTDGKYFAVYCWNSSSSGNTWVWMELVDACAGVYKATIPSNYYDRIIFVHKSSEVLADWDNKDHQSADLEFPGSKDQYTLSSADGGDGGKAQGSWASNYTITTFTISYAGGTASESGSKSDETKTCDVAFTLPGSTFTYGGHTQDGWATSNGGTKAYELSGSYTTNAAQEFYPHWKCNTPEISCSSNTVTITVPSGATVYYTTTTDGSDPATPTSSSTAYNPSSKPTISADTKIKAIAIQSGCTNSDVASASLTYEATGTRYYLFTPTSAPVHGGVLSGQFVTTGSKQNQEKTILEYTFPSYLNGVGTATSMSGRTAGSQGIQYYAKTSTTKFIIYYGVSSSSSTYKICIGRVSEGETSVTSTERSVSANDLDTIQYEFTSTKNTTFSFHINNNNIWIYQIVAIESGTDHKQAGEAGYDLSFNKGRIALDNSSPRTITAEGLTIKSSNSFTYTYTTALSFSKNDLSNNQISFTTPASPGDLKLTWSGGQMAFNTSASADGATNITSGTAYSLSGSTKYYLINTGDGASSITKLQFVTAATTHSVTVEYNGSGSYGTAAAGSTTVGEGSTTTITASPETGYQVNSWEVSGTGSSLSDDGSTHSNTTTLTMGTADATVTCTFGAISYTLAWSSNGGSDLSGSYTSGSTAYGASITAPNDPTLSNYTFDGWKTNNNGTGSTAGSTMPAANTTYYAAWKQTVTLTTGAQGSGDNQTPHVYLNGTGVSNFTAHTADGYTLQGYYTAGSGGVKVLNADGTFAAANVTDYITSSKWSRTGAAPTLYAQWLASEDCSTSDFVIKKGDGTEYQGCMESSSYDGTATSFTAGSPTTVGNAKMTISSYSKGAIARPGSGNVFSIVIEPVSGYYLKSICWAGKVEDDETVSYYWDNNSGSATTITPRTTSGTGVTYDAPNSTTTKFTASYTDDGDGSGGIWWRNVQVEVCAAGGTTYNVTYNDNGKTGGSVPSDANTYSYGTSVTVKGNTGSLAKTDYTFAGWATNDDGTGSNYVADNTFSITANTTLYAKWTQSVTLDKNGGSTDGSATAVWNATGLTGITHAKPASGYKLLGYYSAPSDGTKVLNSDGSFAATNVTGYITSGKWSRTSATTLYAEYESAGALIWNLSVNTDATSLTTSSKTSAFTEISTSNMSNATVNGVSYEKSKKSSLTGKISTPSSYYAGDYVYVKFVVASGYKFTPSSVKVIAQPITTAKSVKLVLEDKNDHSINFTTASTISEGTTQTVEMTNGSSVYFVDTVTLKIYCYGAEDKYRLGTPIIIEGEVEEACATMPSFTRLSFGETSYKVGDTPDDLEVVGGTNITTYAWKQNTVNDRSGGDDADGDNDGSSYTPSTSSAGTMYYWCEMTNLTCGITIKTSAVGITVNEVKPDATVTWDTKAKYNNTDTTAYYGGKNYTLKATLNSGWDGTLTTDMFTAPTGIRLHDFTIDDSSNPKTITATFDVLTTFDVDENDSIEFTLSLPATATYNALSSEKKVAYNECSGSGEGATYNLKVRKTTTKDGNYYYWANTDGWISMNPNSSFSSEKASSTYQGYDSVYNTNGQQVFVRTYHANINKVRIYADFHANNMTVSNVYKHTTYFSAESKYEISADDYTAVYNGDEENTNLGDAANGYVDIILNKAMSENDILLVKFSAAKVRPYGAKLTESSAGSLTTSLAWSNSLADKATVAKTQSSANFTYTASPTSDNSNTLGSITYTSSNTSCATVNATTGEVTITATGTSDLTTTITATLAASGCFQSKTITYTISVPGVSCSVTTGTLTSDVTSKCSTVDATLTLTGFDSGAMVQWYKGESTISDGDTYGITTEGTTSTMVTKEVGTYSVMVTKDECSDRSNSITISNISATASVTKIVDEWYVKYGRVTPDIALWSVSEGATLKSVTWDNTNETGLSCYARDGVIYLEGKEPSSNESGADIEYTLTATITDECGGDHEETTKTIKITHQKNTDKHVLAFVVNGTDKGGFTEGITAAQTTDVPLYKTIAANFDVQATNCYASDDEKKVKQYYSQFDILCITDYPNSNKTGANKKKYVDVLGTLIDIRPILTMEAFVSDKANWKAKGISGNPKDPTTRQYAMDLQCKDHEIFAGTNLVKIGEDDETMYRVTMVEKDSDQYKTLDATYGAGAHGKDDGYAYHKYPALQGFTFSTEMLSDGLLPLGLIDDGSGNELQVGVERQAEMSARLMVLGVNSYAMERLTPDGQKVIINALNYLMKKREEEIADCSIAFIGGDETNPKDWNTAANWKGGVKPDKTTREIRILAEVEIKNGDSIHAMAPIKIASGGTYNEGADNAEGKITINAGGALIVDGRIQAVTAPNYSKARGTSVEDIVLNTSSSAQAALIFNNDAGDTKATVNFYSLGRKDGNFQYQYIASPMEVVPVSESYAGTGVYTYVYTEAAGWERRGYYTDLYAFEGVAITTRSTSATVYTVQGTLANTKEREISITKDNGGDNMIGNSWVAPIQISELEKAPNTATLASKTVYVYCSGRDAVEGTGASGTTETAGQWLAIPFNAASFAGWSGLKVVPAMNAFEFMATAAGTLTLNYDTLVRGNHQNLTAKARAPKRKTEHEGIDLVRIRVADTKTHIDIHLFEGDVFSEAFDDGWEAKYIDGEGVSAQLYAMNGEDKMAVLATSTLESTVLGFVPGREREYTFSFHGADNGYYLNDLKLKTSTPISETEHYTFTYEEGDTHRFYISKTRIDAPQTPTDVTNPEVETPKAQKFIYKDKMYIMINGRVYSAEGQLVK